MSKKEGGGEYRASLGEVEEPTAPFQITSMDITGPYPLTPRRNRYILTFIDHYTKYVEAFPIPDQSAQTCARVYATEILTRHGTGSKLITDQGTAFMSVFFSETCKALGIRRARTTPYHPSSNGVVERLHKSLHAGLSHYVNSHTNWDEVLPFFLMAYRATPIVTTGYSPFFLLHGREMSLPSNEELNAKVESTDQNIKQRIDNLRTSLKQAYKAVNEASRKSQKRNKKHYDRRAKSRSFAYGDYVYLHNPARKPGLSRKFHKYWVGPYKVTAKVSELSYEILGKHDRRQVVHINRLKPAVGYCALESNAGPTKKERARRRATNNLSDNEQSDMKIGACPLVAAVPPSTTQPSSAHGSSHYDQTDSPLSERRDPTYVPGDSPRSRREMRETRQDPPLTRSRTKSVCRDQLGPGNVEGNTEEC